MRSILPNMDSKSPRRIPFAAWVALWMLLASFSLLIRPVLAADTTPPTLTSFDFNPKSVDVTSGDATVEITMHVTDDLSGFSGATISFYSPSFGQYRVAYPYIISGTPLNGDAQGTLTIPKFSEAGDWSISGIQLYDNTGNSQILDKATLSSLGFPTTLTVVSEQDVTPPQLNSFSLAPAAINVSSGTQSITLTMGFTDPQSGLDYCRVSVSSPSGKQYQSDYVLNADLLSGTLNDGVCRIAITLPRYAEAGTWRIYVTLVDKAGNNGSYDYVYLQSHSFPSTFAVAASPSDTETPKLANVTFTPNFVDTTTGPKTITLTLSATDNLSGVNVVQRVPETPNIYPPYFIFQSPSGGQSLFVFAMSPLAGTPGNLTWQGIGTLPQYAEAGTWNLVAVNQLQDEAGNRVHYDNAQLKALGFPTTLQVILPSLVTDGTISDPATGGTVQDEVFRERAQVTVPPNLTQPGTTVSIDVLSSDLHVPVPTGFTTNGTNFVTIELTPKPTPPFPAPGLTIVLPLLSQMEPGTQLTLYRIDPVSGNLTPEPGINGPVVGTVDAPDGLSATFTGVASLSTVVGLIPSGAVLGDLDSDGVVNCADVAIVRASFGKRVTQAGFDSRADTNHDNVINVRDLAFVSRNLPTGTVCRITPTGAIPAPVVAPAGAPN